MSEDIQRAIALLQVGRRFGVGMVKPLSVILEVAQVPTRMVYAGEVCYHFTAYNAFGNELPFYLWESRTKVQGNKIGLFLSDQSDQAFFNFEMVEDKE